MTNRLLENIQQVQLSREIQFTYNTIIFITCMAIGQWAWADVTRAVKSRARRSVSFCSESASVGERILGRSINNNARSRARVKSAQTAIWFWRSVLARTVTTMRNTVIHFGSCNPPLSRQLARIAIKIAMQNNRDFMKVIHLYSLHFRTYMFNNKEQFFENG